MTLMIMTVRRKLKIGKIGTRIQETLQRLQRIPGFLLQAAWEDQ